MADWEGIQAERGDATELVLNFVNTRADAGGRSELLGSPSDFARWARRLALLDDDAIVTESDASMAREIRGALVTVFRAHAGDSVVDADAVVAAESFLRRVADRYPLITVLTAEGARLGAVSEGVPGLLGAVFGAATEAALAGDWSRLKACCNPPCQNGFFDRSRNRTQRFCSPGCGSQVSMRAFRQRKKEQAAADEPHR